MQTGDISDMATVISSMINVQIDGAQIRQRRRRRRRLDFSKQNAANSLVGASPVSAATTTNSDYDEHFKIDRILYNFFGDIMSLTRATQIDFQTYSNGDDNEKYAAQNDAIENFLLNFIDEQSNEFVEALMNLNLLAEMSTPSVERIPNDENRQNTAAAAAIGNDRAVHSKNLPSVENENTMVANDDGDGNFSEKSSIISIQDFAPIISAEQIIEQTPTQERLNTNANADQSNHSDGSQILSSDRNVLPSPSAQSINKAFSRQATPYVCRVPSSSQSQIQSSGDILSSFNATPNHTISEEALFARPTQNFGFANETIGENGHVSTTSSHIHTFSGFDNFSQGFQSMKNNFHTKSWSFDECDPGLASKFFTSQQENDKDDSKDDGFGLDDDYNDNDFHQFLTNSFEGASFSSEILSQRSQRKRPNLQNIRKIATSSQSTANFAINSNSGNIFWIFLFSNFFKMNFFSAQ